MSDAEFIDPYVDAETGVLHNLVGARTQAELDRAEFDLVHVAEMILLESPPGHTRTIAEWRAIHRALFGSVYSWAGELRTVNIAKASAGIGFDFVATSFFQNAISFVEAEIQEAFSVSALDRDEFTVRLAEQYSNLNVLHPFREGNGRTQRFFWNQVALAFGYELDWLSVTAEQNAEASAVAAVEMNYEPLVSMFRQVVVNAEPGRTLFTRVSWHGFKARPIVQLTLTNSALCGFFMPRAKKPCILAPGHNGHHRSRLRTT